MLLIEFPSSRRLNFHAQGCNILPNNNSYAATALSTNDRFVQQPLLDERYYGIYFLKPQTRKY